MVRIVIDRLMNDGERLLPLLRDLRAAAMHQPGYVSGETLVNTQNNSNIIVISTWQSLKDWKAWEASETRDKIDRQIESLLVEKAKVTAYRYLSYKNTG